MSNPSAPLAVHLGMPWASVSPQYRYFVVAQVECIVFFDHSVAELRADDRWEVAAHGERGFGEAHAFVAALIGL